MTTKEAIQIQNNLLKTIQTSEFMYPLIADTHALQVERIFDRGLAGDGLPIGHYSEKITGYYADPGNARSKTGKTGKSKFKSTGEEHKTKYFENYKAYRAFKQKEVSFVNLRFTELFKLDYASALRFENGSVIVYTKTKRDSDILHNVIRLYGERVFKLTQSELTDLNIRFSKKINQIILLEGMK